MSAIAYYVYRMLIITKILEYKAYIIWSSEHQTVGKLRNFRIKIILWEKKFDYRRWRPLTGHINVNHAKYRDSENFLIYSILQTSIPLTGTWTFLNISAPLRASRSAISCGVVTMTAPERGTCCVIESWVSPVPGGMSTTRISKCPQSTPRISF